MTVSDLRLLGSGSWSESAEGVSPSVGLQELVSVGLLRRRDVHFVERRRFAAAADRERRGEARPEGAPPIGRSPGADLILTGSWFAQGADSAVLELRLTGAETGEVVRSWRTATPADADLPSLARTATGGLLRALGAMGRLPEWDDPLAGTGVEPAPPAYRSAGIPTPAVGAYLRGVRAVDGYQWEAARRAFQRALEIAGEGFFEADVALARAARLRAGETLGSDP